MVPGAVRPDEHVSGFKDGHDGGVEELPSTGEEPGSGGGFLVAMDL